MGTFRCRVYGCQLYFRREDYFECTGCSLLFKNKENFSLKEDGGGDV